MPTLFAILGMILLWPFIITGLALLTILGWLFQILVWPFEVIGNIINSILGGGR